MSESEPPRDRTVTVATLEMSSEGRSPRGTLTSAEGRRASFVGWARPGQETTGQRGSDV